MLSRRVQPTLEPSPLYESFGRALGNAYHPITNPNGIISLGIAENTLMYDELASFLNENLEITPDLFGYGAVAPGPPSLVNGLLRLYNSQPFNPVVPVTSEHLQFSGGCTALLETLFWCLCDEGEGVLIGKPLYGGFANDLGLRGRGILIPVSLRRYDPFSRAAVGRYEEELIRAKENGVTVRILVLCTPHNPLGQYSHFTHSVAELEMLFERGDDRVHATLSKTSNPSNFR
jgi:bifunctional pyridoxal-dependent enzyme with beta-cystathionase and maltose regulon repressor activities